MLPPLMQKRHDTLNKVYEMLLKAGSAKGMFDFEKTIPGDLELSWMDPVLQEREIGLCSDFQIVIARVFPAQHSDPHMHEIGSSAFMVLGQRVGLDEPMYLVYKTGEISFPSGELIPRNEARCVEGMEFDVPSNQVHWFENKSLRSAYVLVVTHPTIYVGSGTKDIHVIA